MLNIGGNRAHTKNFWAKLRGREFNFQVAACDVAGDDNQLDQLIRLVDGNENNLWETPRAVAGINHPRRVTLDSALTSSPWLPYRTCSSSTRH